MFKQETEITNELTNNSKHAQTIDHLETRLEEATTEITKLSSACIENRNPTASSEVGLLKGENQTLIDIPNFLFAVVRSVVEEHHFRVLILESGW